MKKFIINIALIITIVSSVTFGETLDNTNGTINNKGTIRVKIGQVKNLPDTLGGRMEFLGKKNTPQQQVPNIVYNQLVIKNETQKFVADFKDKSGQNVKNLTVLDSLIVSDTTVLTTKLFGVNANEIHAKGAVVIKSKIQGPKDLRMNNENVSQNIIADTTGKIDNINIDNPKGVNIVSGGFTVNNKMELTRGELKNSSASNFTMADSSTIVRNVGATVAVAPVFDKTVNVKYQGSGNMASGPELPIDTKTLNNLNIENSGQFTLNSTAHVNDSLYVATEVITGKDTMVLYSGKNPGYAKGLYSEINGNLLLMKIRADGNRNLLNNEYTYATFNDISATNGVKRFLSTIHRNTFPTLPAGSLKVQREIVLKGFDDLNNEIKSGVNFEFGYAWRHNPGQTGDESNNLNYDQVILQRFENGVWVDNLTSATAVFDNTEKWAFSYATSVGQFGSFALGTSGGILALNAKVFLEGPYRYGSMAIDLLQKKLLPNTPPDIYPYNLDPNRLSYSSIQLPDSVVDWVVVEFRKNLTEQGKFRTYLVKYNGQIVDQFGNSQLVLNTKAGDPTKIDSGNYYVILRHRNHMAVISQNYVDFIPGLTNSLDFSLPSFVLGGTSTLRKIDKNSDGSFLYGLMAGDVKTSISEDTKIDSTDYNSIIPDFSVWKQSAFEGYLINDLDMNGIITTKDYNLSFNNRNKVSSVPAKQ